MENKHIIFQFIDRCKKFYTINKFVYSLLIILLSILVLFLVTYLYTSYNYLIFPYESKSQLEGILTYDAVKILSGKSPYADPYTEPMTSMLYPPGFMVIIAVAIYFLGLSIRIITILSFIASLLIGVVIYKIVKDHTKNNYISIVAPLFFYAMYGLTGQIMDKGRVEPVFLLFSLLGLYFLSKSDYKRIFIPFAFILLMFALYTKQDAITFTIAAFIYLFIKNKKLALIFTTLFVIIATFIFFILNNITNGLFYFYVLKFPLAHTFNLSTLNHLTIFLTRLPVVVAIIVAYFIYSFYSGYRKEIFSSIWFIALIVSIPFSVRHLLMIHSGRHVTIIMATLLCIVGGIAIGDIWMIIKRKSYLKVCLLTLLIFQTGTLIYKPIIPTDLDYNNGEAITELIKGTKGKIWIENGLGFLLINGKEPQSLIGFTYLLEKLDLAKPTYLINQLNSKEFNWVLTDGYYLTPSVSEVLNKNYVQIDAMKGGPFSYDYKIYKPREKSK